MVGGVTPGKGGTTHLGLPVSTPCVKLLLLLALPPLLSTYSTVLQRLHSGSYRCRHQTDFTITEGIPTLDMLTVKVKLDKQAFV